MVLKGGNRKQRDPDCVTHKVTISALAHVHNELSQFLKLSVAHGHNEP